MSLSVKLQNSSVETIKQVIYTLFKKHFLTKEMIDDIYEHYQESSKKDKIALSIKEGKKNFSMHSISELLEIPMRDAKRIFNAKETDIINLKDHKLLFENENYKNERLSDEDFIQTLLKTVYILNDLVKIIEIPITKTRFYKLKEGLLKFAYRKQYLSEIHAELKDDEIFYSLTFSINGENYKFHQTGKSFFSKICDDCSHIEKFERDQIPENMHEKYSENEIREMIELIEYADLKISRCCFIKKNTDVLN